MSASIIAADLVMTKKKLAEALGDALTVLVLSHIFNHQCQFVNRQCSGVMCSRAADYNSKTGDNTGPTLVVMIIMITNYHVVG